MKRRSHQEEGRKARRKVVLLILGVVAAFFAGLFIAYPIAWLYQAVMALFI